MDNGTQHKFTTSFCRTRIEGRIFLLLNDKLNEIARTLGKVDKHGNVAEDLRARILGQLSEP
jgi:hypothetical protein